MSTPDGEPDIFEQIEAVDREITYRKRVYARWVENGKMTHQFADRQIHLMQAVLATLMKLKDQGRLI